MKLPVRVVEMTRSLPERVGFFYGQRLTILGQGSIRLEFLSKCTIKLCKCSNKPKKYGHAPVSPILHTVRFWAAGNGAVTCCVSSYWL